MQKDRWFTESEIRRTAYACTNNSQAALLMKVSRNTWKRYASLYLEPTTKTTYYQYLIDKSPTKEVIKSRKKTSIKKIDSIVSGEVSYKNKKRLFERLIKEGIKLEQCDVCGYCEPHVITGKIPIILNFTDNNEDNTHISNLEFLCYNCAATQTNLTFRWTNSTTNLD